MKWSRVFCSLHTFNIPFINEWNKGNSSCQTDKQSQTDCKVLDKTCSRTRFIAKGVEL